MGGRVLSMLIMISIMFLQLSVAQEEDFSLPASALNPNSLIFDPATSMIPDIPSAPTTPLALPSPETCEDKCDKKCSHLIISIVLKLCFKACKLACGVIQSELIYNCTSNCAQSMPASLTSDAEQMDNYVNACYQKCQNHI